MTTLTDKPSKVADAAGLDKAGKKAAKKEAKSGKKGGKKKRLIIIVLVLALGGGAYEFLLAPKKSVASGVAKVVAPVPGPLDPVDAVTVNLTGGHYLRIGLTMQFTNKVSATVLPDTSAALDQMISYLTGQSPTTLNTTAGLDAVKAALTTRIAAVYPKDPLLAVLITTYVIQ